jgi:hypothetical protein
MASQANSPKEAHKVLSTKVRRKIVLALAASVCIGVAPVAPAVSQARIPVQSYPQMLAHAAHCESLAAGAKADREEALAAESHGEILLAAAYWKAVAKYAAEESAENCPLATYPTFTPTVGSYEYR